MNPLYVSSFKVAGTKSCRLASSQLFDVFGGNAQNISDEFRRMFIPRPGYVFIQNDYEGAEAVAVALLVGEGHFRDLIRRKIKPHNFLCVYMFPDRFADLIEPSIVASLTPQIFHEHPNYKPIIKRCKSLPIEYGLAKKTIHGGNYGEGWKTFQESVLKGTGGRVVLSPAEAKRLLNAYFTLCPEIKLYQLDSERKAKEFEFFCDLLGGRFQLIQRFTDDLARTGFSLPPQRTIGLMTVIAATRLQTHIETNNKRWNVLNIVHDSLLVESPEDEAVECAAVTAECMHFTLTSPVDGWQCTVGVEKSIGRNWGKYDETDNPNGVKVID